jgi:hypothetical protein
MRKKSIDIAPAEITVVDPIVQTLLATPETPPEPLVPPELAAVPEDSPARQAVAQLIAQRPTGRAGYLLTRGWEKATPEQVRKLARMGYGDCQALTKREASQLIRRKQEENRKLPATDRQRDLLVRKGLWRPELTRGEAGSLIVGLRRSPKD